MMSSFKDVRRHQKTLATAHTKYAKGLIVYASYKVNDLFLSDDLVQDTFLKTWKYLVKGGKIDIMKAFLYHVLNNLIIDEYRRRKTVSLDGLLAKGFEPGNDPSERLINMLDGKAAMLLLEQIPDPYRRALRMRYIQQLTLAEMALVTGKSKNAMAVQVHRGLAKLRKHEDKK
jgi:RNA polymerase sigma-70 factor (ECF subfamily)